MLFWVPAFIVSSADPRRLLEDTVRNLCFHPCPSILSWVTRGQSFNLSSSHLPHLVFQASNPGITPITCVRCRVRPNKQKNQEFGAENSLLQGHARRMGANAPKPHTFWSISCLSLRWCDMSLNDSIRSKKKLKLRDGHYLLFNACCFLLTITLR